MAEIYPRLSNLTPVLDLIAERLKHDEVSFPDDFTPTEKDIEASVNLLYYRQGVAVYATEDVKGGWHITVGHRYVSALLAFLNNDIAYPKDGLLVDFRGNYFKEVNRAIQRRIRDGAVPMCLFQCMQGTEHIHETIINAALRISQP